MGHPLQIHRHRIVKAIGLTLTLTSCWIGVDWARENLTPAIATGASSAHLPQPLFAQVNHSVSQSPPINRQNVQAASPPTLQWGEQGEAVEQLQQSLQNQGYDPGDIDGIFGTNTLAAVEAFQQDRGLTIDGIVGPDSWQQLRQTRSPLPSTNTLFNQAVAWDPLQFGQNPLLLPGQDRTNPPSVLWLLLMPTVPLLGGGYFYLNQKIRALVKERSQLARSRPTVPETGESTSMLWLNYFPLIGLLSVSVFSFGVYVVVRTSLIGPNIAQLTRAADFKQRELDDWFVRQKKAVLDTAVDSIILPDLKILLQQPSGSQAQATAYEVVTQYLAELQSTTPGQRDIALLTNGGIVVFATTDSRVGQYQPLQNTTTYFTADQVDQVEPNLYVSPLTNELLITLATPVVDAEGQRIGVLAVDLDLTHLDGQIRQPINLSEGDRNYLGETGETYLVGRSSLVKSEFVSSRQEIDKRFQAGISSLGIDSAINRQSGDGLYLNYAKTPVIGVYRWAEDQNLALLAEISQTEVFRPARQLTQGIFWGGVGFTGVSSLLLWVIRRRRIHLQGLASESSPPIEVADPNSDVSKSNVEAS